MNPFDWQRIFLDEFPLAFLGEVILRSLCAFILVFAFLRFSGRRGVRQLSLFEVLVILTLGSAAGDVSFYEDVPLLPIFAVFTTLLCLYRLTTYAMERSPRFGTWMEGEPVVIIREGLYDTEALGRKNISSDEFFMELRQQNVEHLGQVRLGILEVNGDVSLYYFDGNEIRPGLSVLPDCLRRSYSRIPADGLYACNHCGLTGQQQAGAQPACTRCGNDTWSRAIDNQRQTAAFSR
ncbi:hypothetical protein D3C84_445630 [compost metagenome]